MTGAPRPEKDPNDAIVGRWLTTHFGARNNTPEKRRALCVFIADIQGRSRGEGAVEPARPILGTYLECVPGVKRGRALLAGTRIEPVGDTNGLDFEPGIAQVAWAKGLPAAMERYSESRERVLWACWWAAIHGDDLQLRLHYGGWAQAVASRVSAHKWGEIPDPPQAKEVG